MDTTPQGQQTLGSSVYTVIAFCPAVSLVTGGGPQGLVGMMSGLTVTQTNSQQTAAALQSGYFGIGSTQSYTAVSVYGSCGANFAQNLGFWSCSALFRLLAPSAEVAGIVYFGRATVGAMQVSGVTIQQLITDSYRTQDLKDSTEINLTSALVNNNLVLDCAYTAPANLNQALYS